MPTTKDRPDPGTSTPGGAPPTSTPGGTTPASPGQGTGTTTPSTGNPNRSGGGDRGSGIDQQPADRPQTDDGGNR
jgi:hypothetical protein